MDITLIATAAMTILGPYVTKAAGKVAEKVGEDLWTKVKKVFTKDKDKELVKKIEDNKVTKSDLVEIENSLVEHLKEESEFEQLLKSSLHITSANEFILENNLQVAAKIREELKPLYLEQIDAGIAVAGDYNIKIAQLERKLKQIDEKILSIIAK
jgi:hypothetical protein